MGGDNRTVGEYDATTGATVNSAFIDTQGFNPQGLALNGNNRLLVSYSIGTVGQYNATTGATINAAFISGLNFPQFMAVDALNHLFVANAGNNTVGEYDATTGATINAAFINNQGLNGPPRARAGRQQPPVCDQQRQ